ncbi:hypothetical protein FRC01_002427, partial [Tulasnella sp. 417]
MTTIKNSSVIFSARPEGFPIPGEHLIVSNDATINLDSVPLNGGLLVKTIALSVDPYYRILMDSVYKLGEPVVAQIAKQQGLKVIGSAGSDEKVKYLKEELGLDAAFNYKTEDLEAVLKREGPIDIYWDHVGGKTLETVIENMNPVGRIIICGVIDQYNSKESPGFGIKNFRLVHSRELTITGFWVNPLEKREGAFGFFEEVPKLVKEGKIKIREEVRHGFDAVPQFLLDIQQGKNVGKAVVIVADE